MARPTLRALALIALAAAIPAFADGPHRETLTGREALGDWTTDAPGVRRKITVDDLPKPRDTPSAQAFPRFWRRNHPVPARGCRHHGTATSFAGVQSHHRIPCSVQKKMISKPVTNVVVG